jgi:hypothetical protein
VDLPPPASVSAYGLTGRGFELQPILEDLAMWGLDLMPPIEENPELTVKAAWAAMTMKVMMDRAPSPAPEGIYQFEVGPEKFWLPVTNDESILRDGLPPFEPDAGVSFTTEEFFGIATGAIELDDGDAEVKGDRSKLEALLGTFRLPAQATRTRESV